MVQDINASFLIRKDLIVPDDAFPIAKDDNARTKAVVDLVTLQGNVRQHRKQIRPASKKQSAQSLPHRRARVSTVEKTSPLKTPS